MERLRRLRTERGLSQAKLAARAELDPSTVNQIERGAREASPATLRKLAEALDVGIAELLEDASPKARRPIGQPRQATPEEAAYIEWTEHATIDELEEEAERVRGELEEFDRIHGTADVRRIGSHEDLKKRLEQTRTPEFKRIWAARGELKRKQLWVLSAIDRIRPPAAKIHWYEPGRPPLVVWSIPEEEREPWRERFDAELGEYDEAEAAHGTEAVAVEVVS